MGQNNNQFKYDSIFISIFFLLLLANTLDRAQIKELQYVGELSIGLTLFVMFLLLIKTWIVSTTYDVSLTRIYTSFTLLMIVFTASFLRSDYMDGYHYIHLLFHVLFIVGAIRMYWHRVHVKIASYIFGFITVILFLHWMQSGFIMFGFKSIYRNENYLAVFLFALFFFHILAVKYSRYMERVIFLIVLAMNALLIVTTSARSVLIGIFVIFIAWIIAKSYRKLFDKLIYIVLVGNFLFVGLYVGLKDTGFGDLLNGFSLTVFNKNLFSGRPEIWQGVISAILEKPLFGYGLGVKAHEVADTHLTAHNMYLQILLEFGIIGFVVFLLVILSIWTLLMKRTKHFVARLSACFMLGILVYNTFELTLFQNNYSIAVFQWLIMSIGIRFTEEKGEKISTG